MSRILLGLWFIATVLSGFAFGQENEHSPALLLNSKLLRRLQRDRGRQTVRWANFEKRVQSVPDSPERGFELALYYAVTRDEQRGKEAAAWALAHPCERRQVALVEDWVAEALPPAARKQIEQVACPANSQTSSASEARDKLFSAVARADDPGALITREWPLVRSAIVNHLSSIDVYAACEFLIVARDSQRSDLRDSDAHFFSLLPKEFLLSLKPDQVEHPDWMSHIGALGLVALDPNLENSQFVQGWAMEDRQMLTDGPGVAYEFLWADPYLPGIAYQNMDPWIYDPSGRLFARVSWEPTACWMAITPGGFDQQNCARDAQLQKTNFGSLTLIAMRAGCIDVPARKPNETTALWKIKPGTEVTFEHDRTRLSSRADGSGIWPVPNDTSGKICLARQGRH